MLGGFLGAGKTTAVLRLAHRYVDAGRNVGIITNDRGEGLVDTATFRASGFEAEEIPHGCFCRRLDELLDAAGRLQDAHRPDVLFAEPVGSGTNLVTTVIKPLKELYADRFVVAPYVTLLDPERAYQAMTAKGPAGFSVKVTYLYKMQQNEADVVAINKIDTISPGRLRDLTALVERNFPKARILAVSARTGEGFERLAAVLDGGDLAGRNPIGPDDWDGCMAADADAGLAWLNATWEVGAAGGFDADGLLRDLLSAIQAGLGEIGAEPAHVKAVLRSCDDTAVAHLVSSDRSPELSRRCGKRLSRARLVVNSRVETKPALLRQQVEKALQTAAAAHGLDLTIAPPGERTANGSKTVSGTGRARRHSPGDSAGDW